MRLALISLLLLCAFDARASCVALSSYCFCSLSGPIGLVETKTVDGPRVEVELLETIGGLDAGAHLAFATEQDEVVGQQWLLIGQERRLVSDAGTVSCPLNSGTPLDGGPSVALVKRVLGTDQCDAQLAPFVPNPPCNDTGGTCSSGAPVLAPLLLLLLAWRRRTRQGNARENACTRR